MEEVPLAVEELEVVEERRGRSRRGEWVSCCVLRTSGIQANGAHVRGGMMEAAPSKGKGNEMHVQAMRIGTAGSTIHESISCIGMCLVIRFSDSGLLLRWKCANTFEFFVF